MRTQHWRQRGAEVDVPAPAQEEAPAKAAEPTPAPTAASGTYDYEVIVIGAGPGGYETAIKSAQSGKKNSHCGSKTFWRCMSE
ncbi:MAG: hypothetical protein ACLUD0_06185 [Eubacterium ramulus]